MKLVLLNTTDSGSGGAEAAYQLHRSLREIGVTSTLIVRRSTRPDETVVSAWAASDRLRLRLSGRLDRLPLLVEANHPARWSVGWLPNGVGRLITRFNPDVIHLHWIGVGFVPVAALRRLSRPILWTLHNSWPLTGGCHLPGDCDRYQTTCGRCPLLGSRRGRDASRWLWRWKRQQWRDLPITLVAPSRWMADRARSSSLFRANAG